MPSIVTSIQVLSEVSHISNFLGNDYIQLQEINEGLTLHPETPNETDGNENLSPQKLSQMSAEKEWEGSNSSPDKSDISHDDSFIFDQKYNLVDQNDTHFLKVKKLHLNKINCSKTKKLAQKQQYILIEFYRVHEKELESKNNQIDIYFLQEHMHELLMDHDEIFEDLSKYMIFSEENKRFFATSF